MNKHKAATSKHSVRDPVSHVAKPNLADLLVLATKKIVQQQNAAQYYRVV